MESSYPAAHQCQDAPPLPHTKHGVASAMCARDTNITAAWHRPCVDKQRACSPRPNPPQPWRSTDHVCQRHSCLASTMCTQAQHLTAT